MQHVTGESGGAQQYPMLMRANYGDWALLMRVRLQAHGFWHERDDHNTLAAIMCVVPPEMLRALAVKESHEEAWDAIAAMCMGVECVREAHRLRVEFQTMTFEDGETMEDFTLCLTGLVNDL